jgi:hypothetical protein
MKGRKSEEAGGRHAPPPPSRITKLEKEKKINHVLDAQSFTKALEER